jgi:putative photosynthetic complex assembly protein 2
MDFTAWAQLCVYPLIVTVALWVGLTGSMLWLNRCGTTPARWTLLLSIPVLFFAHGELFAVRFDLSVWGCYRAFIAGMLIWAWHELAFYSGVLTGPWRAPCPPNARGWRRFGYAMGTHLYHELAVLVELYALWVITIGTTNPVGPLVFGLCWLLQHSAKLNVFLGVRYLNVDLLPAHLRYLGSFWRPGAPTLFFRISVLVTTVLALIFWLRMSLIWPQPSGVALSLLAVLTTLGALEHWLLVYTPASMARAAAAPVLNRVTSASSPEIRKS